MYTREEIRNYLSVVIVAASVLGGVAGLIGGLVWFDDHRDRLSAERREAELAKLAQALRVGSGNIIIVAREGYNLPATAEAFSRQAAWAAYYGWNPVGWPKVDAERWTISQTFTKPLPKSHPSR